MATTTSKPIQMRTSTKQAWAQAHTLEVLKDMTTESLAAWIDGMNETAGFAKYRAV